MPEQKEVQDWLIARQNAYITWWFYGAAWLAFHVYLLVTYPTTARVLNLGSSGFLAVFLWVLLFMLGHYLCRFLVHTYLGPILFHVFTGILYREDRIAYARSGGYDTDQWPILTVEVGLYVWLRATADVTSDAASFARSGASFLLWFVAGALALSTVACVLAFWIARSRGLRV